MKVMSREFTTTEKVLLVVLSIILLGLLYYKFVYLTTQDMINEQKGEEETLKAELDIANAKLSRLKGIQREMDDIDASKDVSRMESYNNSKNETDFLNKDISGASDYSVKFADVTRDGEQKELFAGIRCQEL